MESASLRHGRVMDSGGPTSLGHSHEAGHASSAAAAVIPTRSASALAWRAAAGSKARLGRMCADPQPARQTAYRSTH